jgi:hypothetical protein
MTQAVGSAVPTLRGASGGEEVLRELRSRARKAQWWCGLTALFAVATPVVGLLSPTTVKTADGMTRPALGYGLLTLADAVVVITALVMRLLWLRRCRRNADVWAPGEATYSFGWVVGAWFTPLLMWWRPRRIVLDIVRASAGADGGTSGGADGGSADGIARLVNTWWALHVSVSIVGVCSVVAKSAMSSGAYQSVQLALAVVGLAGLALFLSVVSRVTALQEARLGERSVRV